MKAGPLDQGAEQGVGVAAIATWVDAEDAHGAA
jgi:hypothetical protein